MIGFGIDETQFNKFINLDSIDTRIINYLKDDESKDAERIWKLLKYSDMRALFQEPLSKKDKNALIYRDIDQNSKRIFTMPLVEDSLTETCSILKIYLHSIVPTNHLLSVVNVQIDILSHNKLNNVYNDDNDLIEGGREVEEDITVKNRNNILLKSILKVLNGANIEGIGKLQFNNQLSKDSSMKGYSINNKINFYGYSLIMSCNMSGVGEAIYG